MWAFALVAPARLDRACARPNTVDTDLPAIAWAVVGVAPEQRGQAQVPGRELLRCLAQGLSRPRLGLHLTAAVF